MRQFHEERPRSITSADTAPERSEAEHTSEFLRNLIASILARHHEYLKHELPGIEAGMTEAARIESGTYRQLAGAMLPLLVRFRQELEGHMKREELNLFPLIERLECAFASRQPAPRNSFGPLSNAIQFMNEDHDFENSLLDKMAEISHGFAAPPDAHSTYTNLMTRLQALKLDLEEHTRKEDEILFPAAIRLEEQSV